MLTLAVAACGGDDEATGSQERSKPAPVAQIDAWSGQKTEVMHDAGFVDALGAMQLTPAPVADGKITKQGVARLPITGGT
jgi:ABC-type Fe3+-citrate transport system substrate-binding protein